MPRPWLSGHRSPSLRKKTGLFRTDSSSCPARGQTSELSPAGLRSLLQRRLRIDRKRPEYHGKALLPGAGNRALFVPERAPRAICPVVALPPRFPYHSRPVSSVSRTAEIQDQKIPSPGCSSAGQGLALARPVLPGDLIGTLHLRLRPPGF